VQPTRAKFLSTATTTVITLTDTDHKREAYINGGWYLRDDDTPAPPEPDPLASAQSRRAAVQVSEEP